MSQSDRSNLRGTRETTIIRPDSTGGSLGVVLAVIAIAVAAVFVYFAINGWGTPTSSTTIVNPPPVVVAPPAEAPAAVPPPLESTPALEPSAPPAAEPPPAPAPAPAQ